MTLSGSIHRAFSTAFGLFLIFTQFSIAQTASDGVLATIAKRAALTNEELSSLNKGETVVKTMPATHKQETAVFGIIKANDMRTISISSFRQSLSQKSGSERSGGAKFSTPPAMQDLAKLKLEERDIEALQKCSAGKCDMNLSADSIKRFQTEVNWDSDEKTGQVTSIFREILLQYVTGYLEKGDASLGYYNDRNKPVDLAGNHKQLLDSSELVADLAPDLVDFLKSYPHKTLTGVESEMYWSTVDFGLKPMETLTQTVSYAAPNYKETSPLIIAVKQIYASRYLDSSISFTMLIHSMDGTTPISYLIFTDRSRSDALGGVFDNLTRSVVEREADQRVKNVLETARTRLESEKRRLSEPQTAAIDPENASSNVYRPLLTGVAVAVALAGIIALFYFARRRR